MAEIGLSPTSSKEGGRATFYGNSSGKAEPEKLNHTASNATAKIKIAKI